MSCNGCRVLRKGCTENCTLRPCLEWIESPESQANATLFLAKFYGRAGLINLIKSGPAHLSPETFRSLLYEACGRIISPVLGSVGLLRSGHWARCQAAVEAVLHGAPLMIQVSDESEDFSTGDRVPCHVKPLQGCDIRHLFKDSSSAISSRGRVQKRSKRSSSHVESRIDSVAAELMNESEAKFTITGWDDGSDFGRELKRARSHESGSVETVEAALLSYRVKAEPEVGEMELELTLGRKSVCSTVIEISDSEI